ncbi:MAG: hypothetical protein JW388_0973 [Nitrospira sp.]|nr:hypothetical protein [Nitrospira sp.]
MFPSPDYKMVAYNAKGTDGDGLPVVVKSFVHVEARLLPYTNKVKEFAMADCLRKNKLMRVSEVILV